jgi:hypothetical protein
MQHSLSWVGPLSLGAALMYLFDPSDGRRRRAQLADRTTSFARRAREGAAATACDLQNRVRGVAARLRDEDDAGLVMDAVVDARVRTAIGRVSTHPGAIGVAVVGGIVELNGPVLASEHDAVIDTVVNTRGVLDVVNHLTQHESADTIPGLQGEGSLPASRERVWPQAALMCAAAGSAGFIAYGLSRRGARDYQ